MVWIELKKLYVIINNWLVPQVVSCCMVLFLKILLFQLISFWTQAYTTSTDSCHIWKMTFIIILSFHIFFLYLSLTLCALSPLVVSGAVEHGNHYSLTMVYEHILERSAFNMTYGPFGRVKSKLSIIINYGWVLVH